jgi:NAD(P)-dependent dehydrogenase (short-subunit alcohol dehydrogenase family)
MATWSKDELRKVAEADDLHIAPLRAYHASKHGALGLTKSAALEYAARSLRINAVCPEIIDTPMAVGMKASETEAMNQLMKEVPIGRLGQPEEIAAAVLLHASPRLRTIALHPSRYDPPN